MQAASPSVPEAERIDQAMLAWFGASSPAPIAARLPFSETDLRGISDVLRRSGRDSWSRIPRTYTVLRIIQQLPAIDDFLSQGLSDVWFPFSQKTLPTSLKSQAARCDFLEAQRLVLTKALNIEKEDSKHHHFSNPADIPLQKVAELGKGAFGYVDRVLSTISYKEYARKLIPRGRTFRKDQEVLRDFERELATLKKLSHIHIVELVGSYTDPRYVGIIMSPVADYNLKEFLDLDPLLPESRSFLWTFFGCLTAALMYLHENRIRHKDIKPQNVLVKGHQVLLTDFGISRDWTELGHSTTTGPTTKTPRYCAPEVAAYKPRNSLSDIWSLGCVFLEIWSVLCGETVSKLTAYMSSSGSCSSCYNQNPDAISSWCDMICSKLGDRELEWPCRWIMSMLEANPKDRCNAQALFERIQEVDADPDVRHSFTGMCCNEEEHTAESVISSDFEHDHMETTDLSSVQSTTVIPSLVSRQELTEQPASTPKLVEVHARQVELLPPESISRSQNSELASLEFGRQATQAADTVEVVPFQSLPGEATSILQATDSYLDGLDLLFAQPDTATQLQTTDSYLDGHSYLDEHSYLDGIDLLFVQPDTSTQLPNGRITSSALEEKHKRLNPSDSTTSFVKLNDEEREKRPTLTVANLNKASPEMNTTLAVLGTTRDANYSYKNKKPYTCLACGQSFRSNSQLHGHLRASEHAVAGVCHTCGLSFASDNHMNKHRSEYRHKVQAARGTHDGPNGSSKPLSDPIGPNKFAIPIANRQPSYSPDSRRFLATTTPTSNYKPENRRLPQGWERRKTDTGKVYYVDHTTMQTAWEIPDSAFNVAFEKTSLPQDGPKKKKSSIWKLFRKKEKNALEA